MKEQKLEQEQKWEESLDSARDFLDAAAIMPAEDVEEEQEVSVSASTVKSDVTELRRRIEERMDSKRIDLEYDYEDLDEWPDSLQ